MAFNDLSDPVYDAIKTYVESVWDLTTVKWPNESFDLPSSLAPWMMFEITGTMYGQQSIGASVQAENRWDEEGQIFLHIMVPTNSGGGPVRGAARYLANLFRGKTLLSGNLEFLDASIGMGEPGDEDGNYFRISVSVDWRYWDASA